jgi:hypothetical protein
MIRREQDRVSRFASHVSIAAVAVFLAAMPGLAEAKRDHGQSPKKEKGCSSAHGHGRNASKCNGRGHDCSSRDEGKRRGKKCHGRNRGCSNRGRSKRHGKSHRCKGHGHRLEAPPAPDVSANDRSVSVHVNEGPNPPFHTGVDVYAGTSPTNLELACRNQDPSHGHDCSFPVVNGQRYFFASSYELDGVPGDRSALVSGWPDWCNPEDFDSPDRWPGSNCWRPFADTSPWNTLIPPGTPDLAAGLDNAKYSSAQSVQALTACDTGDLECEARHGLRTLVFGNSQSNDPPDFKHPIYYAKPTDPYVTLHSRDCQTGGPTSSPLDGKQVRIPAEAQPAKAEDHHLAIVVKQTATEPADGAGQFFEYGLFCADGPPGGTWDDGEVLNFAAGRRVLLDGEGVRAAATAARFPSLGGRIRPVEMENRLIRHALFLSAANMDDFGCVYPATVPAEMLQDTGPIVYGTRFQLKDEPLPGVDWRTWMSSLGLPDWQRTILTAMHDYGAYLGDRTTGGGFTVGFESGMSYTAFGRSDRSADWAALNDDPSTTADGISLNPSTGNYELNFDGRVDWSQILRAVKPPQASCPSSDVPISQDSSG